MDRNARSSPDDVRLRLVSMIYQANRETRHGADENAPFTSAGPANADGPLDGGAERGLRFRPGDRPQSQAPSVYEHLPERDCYLSDRKSTRLNSSHRCISYA